MRAVPSLPAVARRVPSGDEAIATIMRVWPARVPSFPPVATSRMRTVSPSAMATRVRSGDQAAARTQPMSSSAWVQTTWPLVGSQIRAVPKLSAEARWVPSDDHASACTPPAWPPSTRTRALDSAASPSCTAR